MEEDYKRIFDAIQLSPERRQEIRSELTSRRNECQKEDTHMSGKPKRIKILAAALLAAAAFSLLGFAYGNRIISLFGGGTWETGTDENGKSFFSMTTGFETDPVEIQDGQVYFKLDGSGRNITEFCSENTYFQYDTIDENGIRHVILVGGTPDNIGWAEFIFPRDGHTSYNATYNNANLTDDAEPAWLTAGRTDLEKTQK